VPSRRRALVARPRCLGVRGVEVMLLAPAGEIDRGVQVAVSGMSAHAGQHPVGQRQIAADGAAGRAELARRVPAIRDKEFAAAPGLFVA
jgi:hypothetical protein